MQEEINKPPSAMEQANQKMWDAAAEVSRCTSIYKDDPAHCLPEVEKANQLADEYKALQRLDFEANRK